MKYTVSQSKQPHFRCVCQCLALCHETMRKLALLGNVMSLACRVGILRSQASSASHIHWALYNPPLTCCIATWGSKDLQTSQVNKSLQCCFKKRCDGLLLQCYHLLDYQTVIQKGFGCGEQRKSWVSVCSWHGHAKDSILRPMENGKASPSPRLRFRAIAKPSPGLSVGVDGVCRKCPHSFLCPSLDIYSLKINLLLTETALSEKS